MFLSLLFGSPSMEVLETLLTGSQRHGRSSKLLGNWRYAHIRVSMTTELCRVFMLCAGMRSGVVIAEPAKVAFGYACQMRSSVQAPISAVVGRWRIASSGLFETVSKSLMSGALSLVRGKKGEGLGASTSTWRRRCRVRVRLGDVGGRKLGDGDGRRDSENSSGLPYTSGSPSATARSHFSLHAAFSAQRGTKDARTVISVEDRDAGARRRDGGGWVNGERGTDRYMAYTATTNGAESDGRLACASPGEAGEVTSARGVEGGGSTDATLLRRIAVESMRVPLKRANVVLAAVVTRARGLEWME
ncbi:hypothetical protein C8R44DRAFT_746394 [Mycena epipterygia]|nr:hypothetical protein C8R44DRAFT_746394 [Mycena epipterygia]